MCFKAKYRLPLLLLLFLLISTENHAESITVCSDCDNKSITDAIGYASPGDTIFVNGGHYTEGNIQITKRLTLIGLNNPVIDGENSNVEIITIEITEGLIVITN